MATSDIEPARLKALDERRAKGAEAWSPSMAREAIRAHLCAGPGGTPPPHYRIVYQDAEGAVGSAEEFEAFKRKYRIVLDCK